MPFDVEGARKAGYTDAEIAGHLAKELRYDLSGAKSAGYSDSEVISHLSAALPSSQPLPPAVPAGTAIPAATAPAQVTQDASIGQQIIGAGEAALSMATGATGGTIGMLGGTASGLASAVLDGSFGTREAANMVEQRAAQGAQAMTYAPRTQAGQQIASTLGEVASAALPVTPLTAELGALANATRPATQAGRAVAGAAGQAVTQAAREAAPAVRNAITAPISSVTGRVRPALGARSAGTRSVGAAEVPEASLRRANAESLDVPMKLTEGQATRDHGQQQFERETAKNAQAGAPLRERFDEQNEQMLQNFESFVDRTGARAIDLRAVGTTVDSALIKQFESDKARVRAKYNEAAKSEEASALIDSDTPVTIGEGEQAVTATPFSFLNEQPTGLPNTGVADSARQFAVRLGIADLEDGQLVPRPATVAKMEEWRRAIGESTGYDPTDIRTATIMKKLIDAKTEPVAGPLYRAARAERTRVAQNYENRSVLNKLITKKRGTEDRQVAFEDVFSHSILDGSLDDVRQVRRVLHRAGEDGHQAWKELQGATMRYIKDEATKNVARDQRGNAIVSASGLDRAIRKLDADGKLEFVFGKRGAEQLRIVNDVAKDVYVSVPGAVNHSNTATAIAAMLDIATASATGIPAPIASGVRAIAGQIKDKRLAARVRASLGDSQNIPSKF